MKVAVVGAGITGLAAGWELLQAGADVAVYEASGRTGGKILTSEFAGQPIDEGPDAFLARVPWATELCRELGLDDGLVSPAEREAFIYSRGSLRPLPRPNVLGVPLDFDALANTGIVSSTGVDRARREPELPGSLLSSDESVGRLIRRRLGDEVADRLVDPLIGGINASSIDNLSVRAAVPQLAEAAAGNISLVRGLGDLAATAQANPDSPVFFTLSRGLGYLVDTLADRLGHRLHLSTPVADLSELDADRVIVTVPTPQAEKLIAPVAPTAAEKLAGIEYASVTLVTLAFAASQLSHPMTGSGYLVPAVEGRTITACSWASSKWAHLGDTDTVILRVSVGRHGDNRAAAMGDRKLLKAIRVDLEATMGLKAKPVEVRVSRWEQSLPQYLPGHLNLVDDIEQSVNREAPWLRVTGAWARGLGVPACIRQGREAARSCLRY